MPETVRGTLDLITFSPSSPAVVWVELDEHKVSYQVDNPDGFEVNGVPYNRRELLRWLAAVERDGKVIGVALYGATCDQSVGLPVGSADKAAFFGG